VVSSIIALSAATSALFLGNLIFQIFDPFPQIQNITTTGNYADYNQYRENAHDDIGGDIHECRLEKFHGSTFMQIQFLTYSNG